MTINTKDYQANLATRLAGHVQARLGVPVSFVRWDVHQKTGASIPVFNVPQSHQATARELGLTIASE